MPDIKIGDRIKFKSATRWSYKAVVRKVVAIENGRPEVRFGGWSNFVVRPDEIIAVLPALTHAPRICERVSGSYQEHGTTAGHGFGKSETRRCPACGREARWLLNYLGSGGHVLCDGERFYRPHEQTLRALVTAIDAQPSPNP